VYGDYGRLRQLQIILLDNAIKFSPQGGVVEIALMKEQDRIILSISDQGPGIEEQDLPYIFDRFYKQRSEENKSGTGLGLAIAKQIADRHHATIKAINRPETGSTFIFTIPELPQ
jgi:signal transduction histidine kinase